MEFTLKIKVKLVIIFVLFCSILGLLSALKVSIPSLLRGVDLNKVKVETTIDGQVSVLDNTEKINIQSINNSTLDSEALNVENAELVETDEYYTITGQVDSSVFNSSLKGIVDVVHKFDKNSKKYVGSEITLDDKLDDAVINTVSEEVANSNNNITESQMKSIVTADTQSTLQISPSESSNEVKLEDELKDKLAVMSTFTISNKIKTVTVNNTTYQLGKSIYKEEKETPKDVEFIVDNNIVIGIKGKKDKINYLTEKEITEEIGNPVVMNKTKYWNVSSDNGEINIILTDDILEVLYKL